MTNELKIGRVTMPSKRLTDPDFQYRPAVHTDLAETFRKARERQNAMQYLNVVESGAEIDVEV